jgi:hypothetical protein
MKNLLLCTKLKCVIVGKMGNEECWRQAVWVTRTVDGDSEYLVVSTSAGVAVARAALGDGDKLGAGWWREGNLKEGRKKLSFTKF